MTLFLIALMTACDPGTTRPDLVPFPESRTIEVTQERRPALELLRSALVADSFPVARVDTTDLWLETSWFDAGSMLPSGSQRLGAGVVKLRGWSDPSRPGHALLVVELVYRPFTDPSLPPRELERPLLTVHPIYLKVGQVLKALQDEFGASH